MYSTLSLSRNTLGMVVVVVTSFRLFQFFFINAFVGLTGVVSMKYFGGDFYLRIRLSQKNIPIFDSNKV